MQIIARLVARSSDKNDGLILGAKLRNNDFFKDGVVYEIVEIMGEYMVREAGTSCIPPKHWNWSVDQILRTFGKYIGLTKQEYEHETSTSKT